uniref:NADH:ubiquinone oxidoreductase intermediate-associated protein 30 domain-containing protein n=1 Tax=Pseudo-nitzschia delicatissima TaxID=44447 RepID=A0A7S0UNR5_9STRA|mmetsp:Transcript_4403/g.9192  ORF Transcript_4403/g.9192 Transcript_4403/m.9192 type:complete len:299 (+) Transcript_4403:85-981(+)
MTNSSLQFLIAISLLSLNHALQTLSFPIGGRVSAPQSVGYCGISQTGFQLAAKDNKAMSFLKKIGKVGGTKVDFTNAVGVDEGSGGAKCSSNVKQLDHDVALKKARHAYRSCVDSGTIDDLTESFPITSSGTVWAGVTDKVMGGKSSGHLVREDFQGRLCNVLTANVRLANDGGFVQMVTDLALDPAMSNTVDASQYDGLEFEAYYEGDSDKENFNVHLKDRNCNRQFSSYRATFELPEGEWTTVRLPWSRFDGFGWGAVENLLDTRAIRRIGLVAIGKEMDVSLALSSIRFLQDVAQ